MQRAIFFSLILFANFLIISCSSPSQVENKKIQSGQYYLSVNENSTKLAKFKKWQHNPQNQPYPHQPTHLLNEADWIAHLNLNLNKSIEIEN